MAGDTNRIALVNEFILKGVSKAKREMDVMSGAHQKFTNTITKEQKSLISLQQDIKKYHNLQSKGIPLTNNQSKKLKILTNRYTELGGSVKEIGGRHKDLLTSFTKFRWALVNVAMAAGVVFGAYKLLLEPSLKLEKQMIGVAKTTGMSREETKELTNSLSDLSTILPISVFELAQMAKVAGQLGIAKQDIDHFVTSVTAISMATGITADQAATDFAKLTSAFNKPIEEILQMGNVLNELENTTAATAQGMINALTRVGASAELLGVSFEATSAALATLISAGMGPERAGTRLRALFSRMATDTQAFADIAGMSFEDFSNLLITDTDQAIMLVISRLQAAGEGSFVLAEALDAAGRVGGFALGTLVGSLEDLRINLEKANVAAKSTDGIIDEVTKSLDNNIDKFKVLGNTISKESRKAGDAINEGIISELLNAVGLIESTGVVEFGKGFIQSVFGAFSIATGEVEEGISNLGEGLERIQRGQFKQLFSALEDGSITQDQFNKLLAIATKKFREEGVSILAVQGFLKLAIVSLKEFNEEQKKQVDPSVFKFFRSMTEAFTSYDHVLQMVENSEGASLETKLRLTRQLEQMEKAISKQYGPRVLQGIKDYAADLRKTEKNTETLSDKTLQYRLANNKLNRELEKVRDSLSKVKDEMSAVESAISNILSRRFTIGGISETEIGHIIRQQEIELKKAQFSTLGLGTAENFLRKATILTTEDIIKQTSAVKELTKAASDGQDQFESWKTSLTETIRALLINSQDIERDVTTVVRKAQTELLSITKFDRGGGGGGDQFSAMQENIDALGLANDIFFGSEREQLQHSELLREDRMNGMNESAVQAISNLTNERDILQSLIDTEKFWIKQQEKIRKNLETNKDYIKAITAEWNSAKYSQNSYWVTLRENAKNAMAGTPASEILEETNKEMYEPKKYGDFISRPGIPVAEFSPDDTIIGTKGGGVGKTINATFNITESNDPRRTAIEIQRQLASLA